MAKREVPANELRWQCDPNLFDFECTKDLAPLGEFIGQERAIKAIDFGLYMDHEGYNIYVAGLTGTGKNTVVKSYIKKLIERMPPTERVHRLRDWCCLYNFADPDRPIMIDLPQGRGRILKDQISELLERLKEELTQSFSSEEYKRQTKELMDEGQEKQHRLLDEVGEEAKKQGFLLQMTPVGPVLIPLVNGKPMSQAEFAALEDSKRKGLEEARIDLLGKLQATMEKIQELGRQTVDKVQETDKAVADFVVSRLFQKLIQEYQDLEKVRKYLADLKAFTIDNLNAFKGRPEEAQQPQMIAPGIIMGQRDPFLPFQVNVFVDNSATADVPVITEPNPNYVNLFGRIERRFLFGGYVSDHTMLKPGAVHLANGGYLLLSARDVLLNPGVWPTLKRVLKTREIRIEDPFEQLGLIAPQGLKPEPTPIDIKIVLIGDAMLYQMLAMYDEDFWEIFKVKADFDHEVARTRENLISYAAFISGCCEECELRHFDRTGVARVVEYAARLVADQEKLSTRFAFLKELVEEAEYWAGKAGAPLVSAQHVDTAIEERRYRHNLPDEKIKEMIARDVIMVDVAGAVEGQVNGLSVYSLGDVTFGKPSRITCKTFLGRGGVINIERESQLSGRIHDKGVLILSGYMGWKYAQQAPLSLSASLCFEQSYEGIEGDSASSTELYALLSSLSGIPLKQNIAVTGSVNQKGEVQPIGGVNQKIEGFFHVCKLKGLTGDQGVMIPGRNLKNLMLRQEVVDAVRDGKFHIYAVDAIDDGIEVITGVPAGQRQADGAYSEGTVNHAVDKQLKEMATRLKQFQQHQEGKEKEKD
ncbi:MAG: AAA family ATPase [Chloroflexi bacterium]|nr:AAA family ATPase [Chloroflexota bacterium]